MAPAGDDKALVLTAMDDLAGAGLATWFISTSGNRRSGLPMALPEPDTRCESRAFR